MITAKELQDAWSDGYQQSRQSSPAAWEYAAKAANEANRKEATDSVPRIIHASFWKSYYRWAEGLEKVLRSEQVDPAGCGGTAVREAGYLR